MKLEDIVETSHKPALLLWWQWVGVAIVVLALLLLARMLLKNKKVSPPPIQNLKDALERLSALKGQDMSTKDLAVSLSLVIRQYIQHQFLDPALFETHEEFHARSQDIKRLPPEAASRLVSYLGELSDLKYAPTPDSREIQDKLFSRTEELLRGLDSTTPLPLTSELPAQSPPPLPNSR